MRYDDFLDADSLARYAAALNQRAGGGQIQLDDLRHLILDSGGRCAWCGADLRRVDFEVDHVQPLARGGAHVLANLALACWPCNRQKAAKSPIQFAQEQAVRGQRTPLVLRLLAAHGLDVLTQRTLFDPPSSSPPLSDDDEPPPYRW
ncbi:MAG: HNH endonuclease [Anaerolineae bacterium]|nr:HNH endonuclease [Anaerolineae bacterium]MDW8172653.1 HNH endonuclease signature motif containing protein [Anaerolineae bacterium]